MKKKIEKFEQLIAWQKARKLTSEIYRITNVGRFAKDFGLRNQMRRAAVSSASKHSRRVRAWRPRRVSSISFDFEGIVR